MTAFERVRSALGDRVSKSQDDQLTARCPAHDDRTASLSVTSNGGKVLLHCHAGCTFEAIIGALSLTARDTFDAEPTRSGSGLERRIVATYDYTDASGALLFQKVRYEPKDFRIRRPDGSGGWHWNRQGVASVLYRLPLVRRAIAAGELVAIVEGEKDVHSLDALGMTATCNADGAAKDTQRPKWTARDAAQLEGTREVIVIPDNDPAGEAHALSIVQSLQTLASRPQVKLLRLPGLTDKGDVSDWIGAGGTRARLDALIAQCSDDLTALVIPSGPSTTMPGTPSRITATCAADVAPQAVSWLWPGWLPFGKLVSFDGAPGIGKSTLVIDLIARASRGGPMPNEYERTFDPVRTMIAGVEDGWADTVRPRLDAANADLNHVHFLTANAGESVTIPKDVREVGEHALDLGAKWLHLDSIMGVLDENTNAYSDHEVRRALSSLKDQADRYGLLVTFVRHPRKSGGLAVHAGGGSIAFTALARVGLFVGLDPSDESEDQNDRRRVLAVGKSNLGRLPNPLAFAMVGSPLGGAAISWRGVSTVSADQLAAPAAASSQSAGGRADRPAPRGPERTFLQELLADGARIAVDDIKAHAAERGLAWRTVHRAADDLGVSKERAKVFRGGSEWYLPTRTVIESPDLASPFVPPCHSPLYRENSGTTGTNGVRSGTSGAGLGRAPAFDDVPFAEYERDAA
jgi:5S rRNA maturation endonuclease (ribonuclease M5)